MIMDLGLLATNFLSFCHRMILNIAKHHHVIRRLTVSQNGLAERAVQTIKQGIIKLDGLIHTRLTRFLLNYQITLQTSTGLSPSQLLMGRRLRTRLDQIHPDSTSRVLTNNNSKQKRTSQQGSSKLEIACLQRTIRINLTGFLSQ